MPARASAANQAPLRDRPAAADPSRSAAIAPHPGSWPGLSLRQRESSPSSCPGASAGHFECRAQDLVAHAFIRQILRSHLTLEVCVSRWLSRPDPASAGPVSRGLPDRAAEGAHVAVGGGQSSTSSRAGRDSRQASRTEETETIWWLMAWSCSRRDSRRYLGGPGWSHAMNDGPACGDCP